MKISDLPDSACRLFQRLGLVLLLLFGAFPAFAWNAAGHRLSAVIAWETMTVETRAHVTRLLEQHPAYAEWERSLKRGKPERLTEARDLFAEASTWADNIRKDERFSDQEELGANAWARHRDWHFVNWTTGAVRLDRGGALGRQLINLSAALNNATRPAEAARSLVWLIHLVADAHQPLHVASFRLPDGTFDDGGLGRLLSDPARPRFSETSLHTWWDDLPGPPWLRGKALIERAEQLRQRYPESEISQRDPSAWLEESHALATRADLPGLMAFQNETHRPYVISGDERQRGQTIADRRILEAGVRLGRLLNQLLAKRTAQ